MKKTLAAALAVGAFAGLANADIIAYQISGTIDRASGPDVGQLIGGTFTFRAYFDDAPGYAARSNHPVAEGGRAEFVITGAGNDANNATTISNEDATFWPKYAGTFTTDGLNLTFSTGDGTPFTFHGITVATPGSSDAVIGGPIELDDFAPGGIFKGVDGGIAFNGSVDWYTLHDVTITAEYIPAPGALALLGLGGLASRRRR